MTWKIPLEKLHSQTQFEALQDIDFEAALRRRAHTLKAPGLPRIRFQND